MECQSLCYQCRRHVPTVAVGVVAELVEAQPTGNSTFIIKCRRHDPKKTILTDHPYGIFVSIFRFPCINMHGYRQFMPTAFCDKPFNRSQTFEPVNFLFSIKNCLRCSKRLSGTPYQQQTARWYATTHFYFEIYISKKVP